MRISRNKYFFRLFSSLLSCALLCAGCGTKGDNAAEEMEGHTRGVFAMGTYMTLTAYGESAEEALELSEDKIRELEALWSVTDGNSDIYRVNHSGGAPTEISGETAEVLAFALDMAGRTDGALEPTISPVVTAWGFISGDYRIPGGEELTDLLRYVDYKKVTLEGNLAALPDGMQLDLGAVGKGYTGDILSELLKEQGVASALLDIGGNYERYFIGGDGEQYGHIVDPSTGCPAKSGLASVSIAAKEGKLCDALSTAVYVMGLEKAAEYWKENGGFEMLLVTDSNKIYLTEGMEDDFSLNGRSFSDVEIHVIER